LGGDDTSEVVSLKRPTQWFVAVGVVTLAVSGCTAGTDPSVMPATSSPATVESSQSPSRTVCETTAPTLTVTSSNPTAGETVQVATAPEECLVSEEWEGEIIVRRENTPPDTSPDTLTGSRLDAGTKQPVTVRIPAGLEGPATIMLVPDLDCEGLGDCH
jgi:hypothetical protein